MGTDHEHGDPIALTEQDDGRLFLVSIYNTGERRVTRFHLREVAGRKLRFPCFADPEHLEDYRLWVHGG